MSDPREDVPAAGRREPLPPGLPEDGRRPWWAAPSPLPVLPGAWAAGSDEIRVGLIGCGGRGRGAAKDALESASGVRVVALGDAFKDRIAETQDIAQGASATRAAVPAERCFVGLDAYQKVIAADVNYIILATPPGFRPEHLKAAVAAGKNVFTEKPVAVDGPGIRSVLATYEEAKKKGLGIGAGTQRRHQVGYLETMKRVNDGAIGDITAARCYWNQGALWMKPRQPEWTDLEWQMRNWLYFTWLSGDHIVRAARPQPRRGELGMGTHPPERLRHGRTPGAHRPRLRPHLRSFRHRLRVRERRAPHEQCRQIDGCDKAIIGVPRGIEGPGRAERRREALAHHGTERLEVRRRGQPALSAGAHRPHREHPRRAAPATSSRAWPRARSPRSWAATRPTRARRSPGRTPSTPARSGPRRRWRSAPCRCPPVPKPGA